MSEVRPQLADGAEAAPTGPSADGDREVEELRAELERARAEAREHKRAAERLGRGLTETKSRLDAVEASTSFRVGRAVTSPGRWVRERRRRRVVRGLPPPPSFIVIGAQKGGSRWLRHNLGEHPEVFTPEREIWYFDQNFDKGLDWYRRQFEGWSGERILGESTSGYLMLRVEDPGLKARRIKGQLPDARLFAVLRDPAERAYSAFLHHMRRGWVSLDEDFLAYVRAHPPQEERMRLVVGGLYAASLEPYFEHFGDRLRVFLNDDIRADAHGVYGRALEHIGLDPAFVPRGLDKVRFSNPGPQTEKYHTPEGERRGINQEERAALYPYFAEDIDRLEQLLGRDLSAWRP